MMRHHWEQLFTEIGPDVRRLCEFGDATGNFDPLCRLTEYLNEALTARGLPPLDLGDQEFYRQYTAARTPTRH